MKHRHAFTLIEVLISVLILSTSIVYVLQIYGQNHQQVIYISKRNQHALEDSLFVEKKIFRYNKDTKSAYDVLSDSFQIDKLKSRDILKNISRTIYIPETKRISTGEETGGGPAALIDEVKLKGDYSSSYFHFKLDSF